MSHTLGSAPSTQKRGPSITGDESRRLEGSLELEFNKAFSFLHKIVNRCPQLFTPMHGSLLPCSNLPGQSCVFSCDQGYLLSGASTRTCQGDGSWTGLQTHCTGKSR